MIRKRQPFVVNERKGSDTTVWVSWTGVLLAVSILTALAAFGSWMAFVWTDDHRWYVTASTVSTISFVLFIVTLLKHLLFDFEYDDDDSYTGGY